MLKFLRLLAAFTLVTSLGCRDMRMPFVQPPPMPRSVDDPWYDPVDNPVLDKPLHCELAVSETDE